MSGFSPIDGALAAETSRGEIGVQTPAPPAAAPGSAAGPARPHSQPTDEELDRLLKSGFASEVKVDRVIVPAVVLDKRGRPVQGLQAEDFILTEDAIPQKIDFFHVDQNERVSIAFLLDVSGSMRLLDQIEEAREAIRYFLNKLRPQDQAAVMIFADGEIQTLAPFGTDPAVISARLDAVKAYGQTALHDAIAAAPGIVEAERSGRKAIVLISDGMENASRLSLFDAMSAARRVDVPIYSIGFADDPSTLGLDPTEAGTNAEVLKLISNETGGGFFLIHDPDELKEAIRTVEDDLRSQYVLGYTPPRLVCDGAFRRIQLKATKDRYRVRTRRGYFAGPC